MTHEKHPNDANELVQKLPSHHVIYKESTVVCRLLLSFTQILQSSAYCNAFVFLQSFHFHDFVQFLPPQSMWSASLLSSSRVPVCYFMSTIFLLNKPSFTFSILDYIRLHSHILLISSFLTLSSLVQHYC